MPNFPRADTSLLDPTPLLTTINGSPITIFQLPSNLFDPSRTSSAEASSSTRPTSLTSTASAAATTDSTPDTIPAHGNHVRKPLIIGLTVGILLLVLSCFVIFCIWRRRSRRREKPVAPFNPRESGPQSTPTDALNTKRHIVSLIPSDNFSRVLHGKIPQTPSDAEPTHRTGRSAPVSWSTDLLDSAVRQQLETLNARVQQLESRERETILISDQLPPPDYDHGTSR